MMSPIVRTVILNRRVLNVPHVWRKEVAFCVVVAKDVHFASNPTSSHKHIRL